MTEIDRKIRLYEKQEQLLQFTHFNNQDAWELGCMMVEEARNKGLSPAVRIVKNGYTVFHYGFDGTNSHNDMWLRRKGNTVTVTHMSSLHVGALLQKSGEDLKNDWYLDPMEHAVLGGGFPLTIKDVGVVGVIACSGLPHEIDHATVVRCVARFLGVEEQSVLEEGE